MTTMSEYRFVEAHPASPPTHGPAQAVTMRETGKAVYSREGAEIAVADQRGTAANFLARRAREGAESAEAGA